MKTFSEGITEGKKEKDVKFWGGSKSGHGENLQKDLGREDRRGSNRRGASCQAGGKGGSRWQSHS